MYKEIFDKSTDGILVIEDGNFVNCNKSALKMLQYQSKEQLLNARFLDLCPPFQPDGKSSLEKARENKRAVLEKGSATFEWVYLRADGKPFWIEVVLSDMSSREKIRFLVVCRDISEKKRLEEENAYQRVLLKSILDSSIDVIFYKDYSSKNGQYIGCNHAYEMLLGKVKEEIIGHDDIEIFGKEIGEKLRDNDLKAIKKQGETTNKVWLSYPNGERALFHTMKSVLKDSNGSVIGVFGISRDITSDYKYQKALRESTLKHKTLANTDPLTGIMNRRAIFEAAERLGERNNYAVLMIDVDNFKQINDTYGHEKGDVVLKHIANIFAENLREEDIFGRLGGEEFVIVLHNTDEENAKEVASRLVEGIAKEKVSDDKIGVTVSIGMVMNDKNKYSSFSELLNDADKTLYKAKTSGKNKYLLFK